jgi:hypothetical protein
MGPRGFSFRMGIPLAGITFSLCWVMTSSRAISMVSFSIETNLIGWDLKASKSEI